MMGLPLTTSRPSNVWSAGDHSAIQVLHW